MHSLKLPLLAALATALLAVPALAQDQVVTGGGESEPTTPVAAPYKTNVHVQMAAGYKGPIHRYDPVMVSIRGRGHGQERYDLCITPAPVEHATCYPNRRVNGPGVSTAFSKAGKTKLRWKLSTGTVITRTVRVRR
jgi:hypothetical protein